METPLPDDGRPAAPDAFTKVGAQAQNTNSSWEVDTHQSIGTERFVAFYPATLPRSDRMTKPAITRTKASGAVPARTTQLSLRGVDSTPENGVVLRFSARGETYSWQFKGATFDELIALALSGRVGRGRDVHFDGAKVSFEAGAAGRPGTVRVAIGRKVRIVAPVKKTPAKQGRGRKAPAW